MDIREERTVTSRTFTRTPRMSSSAQTPSLVAHWNAATQESLISFRYCTPFVTSTSKLGPVVSGPKHQILRASVTSHENSSASTRARSLKSSRAVTLPFSMATVSSSSSGNAFAYNRLCLFWDFESATMDDSALTVSR